MLEESQLIQRIGEKACGNDKYGGWRGETCGALIGALMALGLVTGRDNLKNTDK